MDASPEHEALRVAVARQEGIPSEWVEEVRGRSEDELRESAQRLRRKLGLDHVGASFPNPEAALQAMLRDRERRRVRLFGR
jgi:hypothetical protein